MEDRHHPREKVEGSSLSRLKYRDHLRLDTTSVRDGYFDPIDPESLAPIYLGITRNLDITFDATYFKRDENFFCTRVILRLCAKSEAMVVRGSKCLFELPLHRVLNCSFLLILTSVSVDLYDIKCDILKVICDDVYSESLF